MAVQALGKVLYNVARKQYVEKLGRTVYRDMRPGKGRGRIISYQTYKALRTDAHGRELRLRQRLGAPPKGLDWVYIANKYPGRFAGYQ